jgi:hypothetical protein
MAPDHGNYGEGQGPPAPGEAAVGASTPWEALSGLGEPRCWFPLPPRLLRQSEGAFWEEPRPLESLMEVLCCY